MSTARWHDLASKLLLVHAKALRKRQRAQRKSETGRGLILLNNDTPEEKKENYLYLPVVKKFNSFLRSSFFLCALCVKCDTERRPEQAIRFSRYIKVPSGVSSRDMFRAYHEAGMKPLDILQSATYISARHLNKEDEIGILQLGSYADIITVKGNIDTDFLDAIESVVFVMKGGEVYVEKLE